MQTARHSLALSLAQSLAQSLALSLALCVPAAVVAADGQVERRHVVTVMTDANERVEADVSHLDVGESQVLVTDSGTTIDLLRTEDGMEVYIDGELLDPAPDEAAMARLHRDIERLAGDGERLAACVDSDEAVCEHVRVIVAGEDAVADAAVAEEQRLRIVRIEHEETGDR